MSSGFTIGAVGDISLETDLSESPWEHVSDLLSDSDLLFGNLECSISDARPSTKKAVPISVPISRLEQLEAAGFDAVNIANNHTLDSGVKNLYSAANRLRSAGINTVGLNQQHPDGGLTIIDQGGIRVGILGYTESSGQFSIGDLISNDIFYNTGFFTGQRNTYYTPSKTSGNGLMQYVFNMVLRDVAAASQYCDLLIVSLHWGTENVFYPSPRQVSESRRFIDYGADVVLGHHPHVPQGVEEYNGGVIAYSLGNFQFNPIKSKSPTKYSFGIKIDINSGEVEAYKIVPVKINQTNHPVELSGEKKERVREEIRFLSTPIEEEDLTWRKWFNHTGSRYLYDNAKSYKRRINKYGGSSILEMALWLGSPFTARCIKGKLLQRLNNQPLHDATFPDMMP